MFVRKVKLFCVFSRRISVYKVMHIILMLENRIQFICSCYYEMSFHSLLTIFTACKYYVVKYNHQNAIRN